MVSCLVETVTPSKDQRRLRTWLFFHMYISHIYYSTASSPSLHLSYRREHKNICLTGKADKMLHFVPICFKTRDDYRRLCYEISHLISGWMIGDYCEGEKSTFSSSSRRTQRTICNRRSECRLISTHKKNTTMRQTLPWSEEPDSTSTFHFHLPARSSSSFQLFYVYVEVPLIKAVVVVSSVGIVCDRNECSMRLPQKGN